MARLVEHDATEPVRLDASDIDDEKGDIAVCRCGLSGEFPFCDGSHRATLDEGEAVYRYEGDDDENPRHVVERVVYADGE